MVGGLAEGGLRPPAATGGFRRRWATSSSWDSSVHNATADYNRFYNYTNIDTLILQGNVLQLTLMQINTDRLM